MPGNSTPDYYWVLQVNSMAEKEVIDAAYRGLAKKYHPDRYKGSDGNERMREINLAYEVLGDQDKRLAYDVRRSQQSTAQKDTSSRPEYQVGRQNKRLRIHTSNPLILKVRRARKQNKDHSKKHLPGIVLPILKLATIRTGKALDQRAPVNKNTRLIPNRQLILADGHGI